MMYKKVKALKGAPVRSYKVIAKNIAQATRMAKMKAPMGYTKIIDVRVIKIYPKMNIKEYLVSVMKRIPKKPVKVMKYKGPKYKKMKKMGY